VGWLAYLGGVITGVGASALVLIMLQNRRAGRRRQAGGVPRAQPSTGLVAPTGGGSLEREPLESFAAEALRAYEIMRSSPSWPTSEDPRDAVREAAGRARAAVAPTSKAAEAVDRVMSALETLHAQSVEAQTAVLQQPASRVPRTLTLFSEAGTAEHAIFSFAQTYLRSSRST
jgi:hypothetical protein